MHDCTTYTNVYCGYLLKRVNLVLIDVHRRPLQFSVADPIAQELKMVKHAESNHADVVAGLQSRVQRARLTSRIFLGIAILGLVIPGVILAVGIMFFKLNLGGDTFLVLALTAIVTPLFAMGGFFLFGPAHLRRSLEVAEFAAAHGLTFSPKPPSEIVAFLKSLRVFELSSDMGGMNFAKGQLDGVPFDVLDFYRKYPAALGGFSITQETMVIAEGFPEDVPDFMMCPTNWAGKLAGKMFGEGIDLSSYPAFARRFAVHSQDEEGTLAFLTEEIVSLLSSDAYTAEVRQGTLVMFKEKSTLNKEDLGRLFDAVHGVAQAVNRRKS